MSVKAYRQQKAAEFCDTVNRLAFRSILPLVIQEEGEQSRDREGYAMTGILGLKRDNFAIRSEWIERIL